MDLVQVVRNINSTIIREWYDLWNQSRIKYSDVVKQFAEETPRCHYLDVFHYEPLTHEDIYIEDGVHFNSQGYQAMTRFFQEALKGELEQF